MNNLTLFFLSQLSSGFAYELFHSAVAFYILNITGSPLKFSLAFILDNVPKMFLLQFAGYIVDRFNRKTIFILIDVFQSIFLFIVFYLLQNFEITVSHLLLFTFISGLLKSFSYPATKAIVPMLSKDNGMMKASSFEISNDKIARTLAPSLAILVFAKFGISISVLVTAFVYAVSAIVKMFLVIDNIVVAKQNISKSIKIGFQSLFQSKAVVFAWINAVVTQLVFHPFLAQVIPNLLKKQSAGRLNYFLRSLVFFLGGDQEDVYMSLVAILGLASSIGVIFSLLFFQYYSDKFDWKKGMRLSTILLIPASIVMSLAIVYLGLSNNADSLLLTYVLFPINICFYFILNTYTVFFTFFYQEKIGKESIGRFVGNLMTIFMFVKALGHFAYGNMLEYGFILPVTILVISSFVKWFIFKEFEKAVK